MYLRVVLGALALLGAADWIAAQSYSRGQNASPAYEGWEQNGDGSFNFLFGYMNRNWEEELDVPIGPDNNIEPGGPDQGQPTRLLPRRNRFVFRVNAHNDMLGKALGDFVVQRGWQPLAFIAWNNDAGRGGVQGMRAALPQGFPVAYTGYFNVGEVDFSAHITNTKHPRHGGFYNWLWRTAKAMSGRQFACSGIAWGSR